MFSKVFSRSVVSVLGIVFVLSLYIGFSSSIAMAEDGVWDKCGNNDEFTTDFLLDTCKFKSKGLNPYFILIPGYQSVLEMPEGTEDREKSVETVLCDTRWINLDGRWIKTRVLEERAFEWEEGEDGEEGEWVTIEISLNWFAICKRTNAVYYFGEWSRDCEDGFDEDDVCEGEESNEGSWEAGVDGALPGLMMPGTPLRGSKYFQEIAPPDAVDRGEVVAVGFDETIPGVGSWSDCIEIHDTNPAEGDCGDDDAKKYCPGVGLIQDQELVLVEYGFVGCDGDDDDDDDDHDWRRKWGWRHGHWRF